MSRLLGFSSIRRDIGKVLFVLLRKEVTYISKAILILVSTFE